jgi:hypothetical protein
MGGKMEKVLLVEDNEKMVRVIKINFDLKFSPKMRLLSAGTIIEAKRLFSENNDIVAIIMDGYVPMREGRRVWPPNTTEDLVGEIRDKGFSGPIIATSSNLELREKLIEAGCDYQCDKLDVVSRLEYFIADHKSKK